ncbi:MAG: hypothetical protein Q9187_000605 [Circinaria calcarea]
MRQSCPLGQFRLMDRLRLGLFSAVRRLRTNISPRAEIFLAEYKDGIKEALTTIGTVEKDRLVHRIKILEELIREMDFLKVTESKESEALQTALLDLKELQYMASYGDYLKWRLGYLRPRSRQRKTVGYQTIGGEFRWSEINDSLKEERLSLEDCGAKTKPLQSVTMAVLTACHALKI